MPMTKMRVPQFEGRKGITIRMPTSILYRLSEIHPKMTPVDALVICLIADQSLWGKSPSIGFIAKHLNISSRTVSRSVSALKGMGLLRVDSGLSRTQRHGRQTMKFGKNQYDPRPFFDKLAQLWDRKHKAPASIEPFISDRA